MQISPYLNFNGNCAEAMRFYAEVLGGKDLRIMTFRDSPMAERIAANEKDMAIHSRFTVGDFTIMASDAPGGRYNKPQGAVGRRKCRRADRRDLLGQTLWHGHRQVRNALDGDRRKADVTKDKSKKIASEANAGLRQPEPFGFARWRQERSKETVSPVAK
jgi:hypothetical protein